MRGRALAAVAALAGLTCVSGTSGCDSGVPGAEPATAPPRDFASGARLRARYHVVDGLVEVLSTFHDAQLDVDCAFEDESGAHVGPDGAFYCLPGGMARHREGRGPYLDVACNVRAAFAGSGAPASAGGASSPAAYALIEPADACATAPEVRLALPPVQRRVFLRDDLGACVETERASLQQLGEAVPLSGFVRGVEQVEPREGRIAVRVRVGDDGSRRVVGGFDSLRNEPSRVGDAGDGTRRWLPARVAFVGASEPAFTEASCTSPAAAKIARTATCPLSAAVVLEGSCGVGRYFELGARLPMPFGRDAAGACVARPAPEQLAFSLGAPIPTEAYAPVSVVDVGGPRVRRRGVGAGADAPVAWAEVIDVDTGEACEVAAVADGTLRCLPSASEVVAFFADAACTEPAFAHTVTGCETGASPRLVRDAFDVPARVFAVGRELPVVYVAQAGQCVQYAPTVPARLFAASEVDASRFALAALTSE